MSVMFPQQWNLAITISGFHKMSTVAMICYCQYRNKKKGKSKDQGKVPWYETFSQLLGPLLQGSTVMPPCCQRSQNSSVYTLIIQVWMNSRCSCCTQWQNSLHFHFTRRLKNKSQKKTAVCLKLLLKHLSFLQLLMFYHLSDFLEKMSSVHSLGSKFWKSFQWFSC